MDRPGIRKIHATAIPRIGGLAILFAMLSLSIPLLAINNQIGWAFQNIQDQVVALLVGGVFMFLVGLIDDIWDLKARYKLLAQIIAAVGVCAVGIRIDDVSIDGWVTFHFYWMAWPITIFWIIGITNAVNLIDGLDGLAAGITAVTCGVITVFALYTGQMVMAILMLALLGSLTGFLFFNFNPAKVFLGDCGTMFLGFILAVSSVMCMTKSSTLVGLALPALALGIPIFDTFFSILRRFGERRSIFAPDRCHIHHRLLDKGLEHRHVVILMYLVTLLAAGLGMFMMFTQNTGTIIVFAGISGLIILAFRGVGAVHFRDSINAIQRNMAIARDVRQDRKIFDNAMLRIREAKSFDTWWQAVCVAAGELDFVHLSLHLNNRDGSARTLMWRSEYGELQPHESLNLVVPVRQRRIGDPLRMQAAVHVNGSLEAAGRRVAFFSRLIDENGLQQVPGPTRHYDRERKFMVLDFEPAGPARKMLVAKS
jgi:UDP-GlcNAc:undecaprenyl-phosphate GlcNAc-1-phosphate transferase